MLSTKVLLTRQLHIKSQSSRPVACKQPNIFVINNWDGFYSTVCHAAYVILKQKVLETIKLPMTIKINRKYIKELSNLSLISLT